VRGPRKHLKRLAAPSHWMLDKLGGVWAPRPSTGPHKKRECHPLILLLRNRLKYALTRREVVMILQQRLVKVDGKVRTDATYPSGFMDVIQIEKSDDHFRLLYDTKGRFIAHRVDPRETKFKLLKIKSRSTGTHGIPYIVSHDGRTLRYPDPNIRVNDSVLFDIEKGKVVDHLKFKTGNLCMITGGHNTGRIGEIVHRERHPGSFDIVQVKDSTGATFATRLGNVFVIGKGNKPFVSLPKNVGIRLSTIDDRNRKLKGLKKKAGARQQRGGNAAAKAMLATQQELFNFQQASLEGVTEMLGELLFSGKVVEKAEELRNLTRTTRKYLQNIVSGLEDMREDMEDADD